MISLFASHERDSLPDHLPDGVIQDTADGPAASPQGLRELARSSEGDRRVYIMGAILEGLRRFEPILQIFAQMIRATLLSRAVSLTGVALR